jgi:hypothetical protein
MNPVELIRELAEALQNLGGNVIEHTPHELALLTQAQAFLAAQPVVVTAECTIESHFGNVNPKFLYIREPGAPTERAVLCTALIDDEAEALKGAPLGPCTVHVVVTPGAR